LPSLLKNLIEVTMRRFSSTLLAFPQDLVIGAGDKLFVTNFSVPGVAGLITVFAPGASGNAAPAQTITGLRGPIGISL
jgi:hypothetical protein